MEDVYNYTVFAPAMGEGLLPQAGLLRKVKSKKNKEVSQSILLQTTQLQ